MEKRDDKHRHDGYNGWHPITQHHKTELHNLPDTEVEDTMTEDITIPDETIAEDAPVEDAPNDEPTIEEESKVEEESTEEEETQSDAEISTDEETTESAEEETEEENDVELQDLCKNVEFVFPQPLDGTWIRTGLAIPKNNTTMYIDYGTEDEVDSWNQIPVVDLLELSPAVVKGRAYEISGIKVGSFEEVIFGRTNDLKLLIASNGAVEIQLSIKYE